MINDFTTTYDDEIAKILEPLGGQPFRVIGSFAYGPLSLQIMKESIRGEMQKFGRFVDVRNPGVNSRLFGDPPTADRAYFWHRDCQWEVGVAARVIYLWSTVRFTEIWVLGEDAPRPAIPPCSIVIMDNHKCLHRPPRNFGTDRWFARSVPLMYTFPINPELREKEELIPANERLRVE